MKLLLCLDCQDIIKLDMEKRECKCRRTGGKYFNIIKAIYWGDNAIPLGIHNTSLAEGIKNQPKSGWGYDIKAFVIPKKCPTMIKVEQCL